MHVQIKAAKGHKNAFSKTRIAVAVLLSAVFLLLVLKYGLAPMVTRAARENDTDRALFLLRLGANPNFKDNQGLAPIQYAAVEGNIRLVNALIKRGADIDSETQAHSIPPIEYAAHNGYLDIVSTLMNHGAKYDRVLYFAVLGKQTHIVEWLITNGIYHVDVNQDGGSFLWTAAYKGQCKIVQLLLEAGITTSYTNGMGLSALQIAAENGHTDVVATIHHYITNQYSK